MSRMMTRAVENVARGVREGLPKRPPIDEDAIERIVFLAKVEEGLVELDSGKGIPHEQVKRRVGL